MNKEKAKFAYVGCKISAFKCLKQFELSVQHSIKTCHVPVFSIESLCLKVTKVLTLSKAGDFSQSPYTLKQCNMFIEAK